MLSSILSTAVLAALSLPRVHAHGYVANILVDGQNNTGSNPNWFYQPAGSVVPTAGWFALNQDNGFVPPDLYTTADITCHKQATPGNLELSVAPGAVLTLQWNTWPDSHHGPVLDYLAPCPAGSCTNASAADLAFVKLDEAAQLTTTPTPGTWATDTLIANAFSWNVTIPEDLKPGYYVLRHEIIALHSANQPDGAQNYPQCINLVVTGSGTTDPCTTGNCTKATTFYHDDDPGIAVNIYEPTGPYVIPGPAVWSDN